MVLNSGRGLFHLYGYLTWAANSEYPFVNIDNTDNGIEGQCKYPIVKIYAP